MKYTEGSSVSRSPIQNFITSIWLPSSLTNELVLRSASKSSWEAMATAPSAMSILGARLVGLYAPKSSSSVRSSTQSPSTSAGCATWYFSTRYLSAANGGRLSDSAVAPDSPRVTETGISKVPEPLHRVSVT